MVVYISQIAHTLHEPVRDEWRRLIAECAGNQRTVAKVSGLYSATGPMDDDLT